MEGPLSLIIKLPLEEMALRRSFINLWGERDVLVSLNKHRYEYHPCEDGADFDEIVKKKVSNLEIPESLKKRMMVLIKPVGRDIIKWKIFHEILFNWSCDSLGMDILKHLCFTSIGTVDYSKTAEELLGLDTLRVETRYKLAALYCLADYIPDLWAKLPKPCKDRYLSESPFQRLLRIKLDVSWAYLATGQESKLDAFIGEVSPGDTFRKLACKYSALSGNIAATEYFFKQLTNAERNCFLFHLVNEVIIDRNGESSGRLNDFPIEKLSEVLCFLLKQMSPEQQMHALKFQPNEFFTCLLDWPLQDLCLEMGCPFRFFSTNYHCFSFVRSLSQHMIETDHYFPHFLQALFENSPGIFKNIVVGCERFYMCIFHYILNAEDKQTLRIIYRNLGATMVFKLVSQNKFFKLLETLMMLGKNHLVKLCLDEALLSEHQKNTLKELYMKYLSDYQTYASLRKRRWRLMFRDIACVNKRGITGEIVTEAKKVCRRRK